MIAGVTADDGRWVPWRRAPFLSRGQMVKMLGSVEAVAAGAHEDDGSCCTDAAVSGVVLSEVVHRKKSLMPYPVSWVPAGHNVFLFVFVNLSQFYLRPHITCCVQGSQPRVAVQHAGGEGTGGHLVPRA